MKILRAIVAFLLLAAPIRAADFFLSPDGSNGAATNWVTAWRQPGDVNWAVINPGDTIWIAGGRGWYTNRLVVGKSGTEANPIRFKKSRELGYSGPAILGGTPEARISIGNHDWITFDGSDFETQVATNAFSTLNVRQNIGLTIWQTNQNTAGIITIGGGSETNIGIVIRNIRITGGTDLDNPEAIDSPGNSGIGWGNKALQKCVIEYCEIDFMGQDAVGGNNASENLDDLTIRNCYLHDLGDDGVEVTQGVTIDDTRVQRTTGKNGHPDCIVIVGSGKARLRRLILGGFNTYGGAFIGIQHNYASDITFENLLVYRQHTNSGDGASAITVDQTLKQTGNQYWSNIRVVNCTTIGMDPAFSLYDRYKPSAGNTNPGYQIYVYVSNFLYANNLVMDATATAASFKGWENEGILFVTNGAGVPYAWISNNVFTSTNVNGRRVYYQNGGAPYLNAEAFGAATGFTGNSSARPLLVDYDNGDFRPSLTDTVLRGAGADLSALGITNDLAGLQRSLPYDIGALRAQTEAGPPPGAPELMMHLDFEDDFSDGVSSDSSGHGAHMVRFGATNDVNAYWPTRVTSGKHGTYAADFQVLRSTFPFPNNPTFWAGQFGAVTNVAHMQGLPKYTIMVWARFNEWSGSTTEDHNATFFDTGYSGRGGLHFGRYYSTTYGNPRALVNTNAGSIAAAPQFQWPQVSTYSGHQWTHYAMTVDHSVSTNGTFVLYQNGTVVLSTNLVLQLANSIDGLDFTDPAGSTWGRWGAVGCWQHNGTPDMTDTDWFPNNGWMNGRLDDLRIYSGVLSQSEIQAIVAEANSGEGGGGTGGTNSVQAVNASVLSVGTIQLVP